MRNELKIAVVAAAIFLFGGGLHLLVAKPHPAFCYLAVVVMTLYTIGVGGAMFIYQSAQHARSPREARLTFASYFALGAIIGCL